MSQPRILVLGEHFIDRYFIGAADRLSPEAPLPVVRISEVIDKRGGAGNVCANLEALGAEVRQILPPTPFPIKNRLICSGHQLARWDQDDVVAPYTATQLKMHAADFEWADAVILSDYAKGAFSIETIELLRIYCKGRPVSIDTKRNPFIYGYGAGIFFPNLKEYNEYLLDYQLCKQIICKEGSLGATHYFKGEALEHINSYSINPISVSGAGDSTISAFTFALCKGYSIVSALVFAMKAAAVAIGKPLTSVATLDEIAKIT